MESYYAISNKWTYVADMLQERYSAAVTIGRVGPAGEKNLFDALIEEVIRPPRPCHELR
jgi:hypothetical protein